MSTTSLTQNPPKWAPRFFTIWSGQAVSLLGSQLVQFALIWWLTKTTGSATILALASLVGLVPQIVLGPFIGALVDRWNRRLIMIVADSVSALAVVVLAVLFALGQAEVWHVFALMFVRSIAGGFHWPAMQASTSLMVPQEHLARVQGLNQMLNGGLNIISAPLGAVLLEFLPMQSILAIDVVTALLAVLPLFFFAIPQPVRNGSGQDGKGKTSVWEDFREGWRYVFGWRGLVLIGLMAVVINLLLTPAFTLLPILVTKYFNGQALQLAWIESAFGIGILLGGLTLSVWGGFKRRILTSVVGLIGMALGCLAIGFAPSAMFWLAIGAAFVIGFFNPITNGPLFAALQAVVAPEMQGRVFMLISSFASAMAPIGLLIAGPVADVVGVQSWFIVGGFTTLVMAIASISVPAIVHFEEGRGKSPSLPAEPVVISTPVEEAPLKSLDYT
jgi:DHA3 family macrolide efflux protein-like MFS transporter